MTDDRIYTTNYWDWVTYNASGMKNSPSFRDGRIRMISERGCNISTPNGVVFVKWDNILKIDKPGEIYSSN